MLDEEFIAEVQARPGLSSREDAERGAQATIEVLGEEFPRTGVGPLAELLPDELGSGCSTPPRPVDVRARREFRPRHRPR